MQSKFYCYDPSCVFCSFILIRHFENFNYVWFIVMLPSCRPRWINRRCCTMWWLRPWDWAVPVSVNPVSFPWNKQVNKSLLFHSAVVRKKVLPVVRSVQEKLLLGPPELQICMESVSIELSQSRVLYAYVNPIYSYLSTPSSSLYTR
jgi:hypothetical protein